MRCFPLIAFLTAQISLLNAQLLPQLTLTNVTLPFPLLAGDQAWRLWVMRDLYAYPLYVVPLQNGRSLIGWTDSNLNGHVSLLNTKDDYIMWTRNFNGLHVRGVAAITNVTDGAFAVFLWNATESSVSLSYWNADNTRKWRTPINIVNPWVSKPTKFKIGDSRAAYGGDGFFAVYYHVRSYDGHEGDALYYFDSQTGAQRPNTGWGWGCSHSMNSLLDFHPTSKKSMALCVSDCYADTAILVFNGRYKIQRVNGNCAGGAGAELGGMAANFNTWGVVFTSQTDQTIVSTPPSQMEVGYMVLNGTTGQPMTQLKWLTTPNPGFWKTDAAIARWGPPSTSTRESPLLVGWASDPEGSKVTTNWYGLSNNMTYSVALINPTTGDFIQQPIDLPKSVFWGRRDDPFHTKADGSVMWVYGDRNTNILRIAKYQFSSGSATAVNRMAPALPI
ncbi:hypothetical protein BC833DRAFT_574877 [Globomyces pollinis-pini]|nr:hypothetical protein BC833DRAFT_574877 [Globomyces pollinis-pini]